MAKRRKSEKLVPATEQDYDHLLSGISELLDQARRSAARAVNRFLTISYWEVGRRIVEFEHAEGREPLMVKSSLNGWPKT